MPYYDHLSTSSWHIYYKGLLSNVDICQTTYPPRLVNVVFEHPQVQTIGNFNFEKLSNQTGVTVSYLWNHFALFLCNSRYVSWILWRYLVIHQNKWKCVQTRFYVRTMCFYNSPPWRRFKKSRWRTFKNFKIIQVMVDWYRWVWKNKTMAENAVSTLCCRKRTIRLKF